MLCLATLTLAALGPWTYAGFLADPPPPTPPAPAVPAAPSLPPDPTPEATPEATPSRATPDPAPPAPPPERPATASDPAPPPPPPVVHARQATPVLYRMPDATGQVWEHADPSWLQSYVMDRNRQFVRSNASRPCR